MKPTLSVIGLENPWIVVTVLLECIQKESWNDWSDSGAKTLAKDQGQCGSTEGIESTISWLKELCQYSRYSKSPRVRRLLENARVKLCQQLSTMCKTLLMDSTVTQIIRKLSGMETKWLR